ncbi:uncharacterized protein FOBCDRAFT_242294 [Fusarium oxysporum Fo47]|uniref:uncharacterized protein n=1 Tax=Fusarium oxysporum Fo47 TaxID=660027 RepID=UPI002869E32A|nr:uncharacterized protein FOBCDRAFT_242294 [Fusarium oxysporum Fo47]WJG35952.1 hypothetical protein FOBCDRAFT_242294 [Fusarium oxysporum Fo47]
MPSESDAHQPQMSQRQKTMGDDMAQMHRLSPPSVMALARYRQDVEEEICETALGRPAFSAWRLHSKDSTLFPYHAYDQQDPAELLDTLDFLRTQTTENQDIYQRLVETSCQQLGRWKRWLPYYGTTDVIEVKFRFVRPADLDGHYAIHMNIINIEETREKCNIAILRHPSQWGEPCIRLAAKEAEQRHKLLDDIQYLKKCARDPASANGLRTLEGMAQESCIYDVKYE